jgi:hypothetical protein
MRDIWKHVYSVGLAGFGGMFVAAGLIAIGQAIDSDWWPIREGTAAGRMAFAIPAALFLFSGALLVIPTIAGLVRSRVPNRPIWVLGLIAFPLLVSYLYFATHQAERNQR